MNANEREAVVDTMVDYFHSKVSNRTFPPVDDAALIDALKEEVNNFFEDMEDRFRRLEHPLGDSY